MAHGVGEGRGGSRRTPPLSLRKLRVGTGTSPVSGRLGRERFLWSGRGRQVSVGPGWLAGKA